MEAVNKLTPKQELLNTIQLLDDADSLITETMQYISRRLSTTRNKGETMPCQYLLEELIERVEMGEEHAKQGLGCSQEEMRKRISA